MDEVENIVEDVMEATKDIRADAAEMAHQAFDKAKEVAGDVSESAKKLAGDAMEATKDVRADAAEMAHQAFDKAKEVAG